MLTDLAITGKPAQFGRGVMQDVRDKLLGQFMDCLEQRVGEGDGSAATEAAAAAAPPAVAAEDAVSEAPTTQATPAPATPADAPAAAKAPPAAAARARGSDDALNLGTTVLPVLIKSYWKQAVAGVVVVGVIIWFVTR